MQTYNIYGQKLLPQELSQGRHSPGIRIIYFKTKYWFMIINIFDFNFYCSEVYISSIHQVEQYNIYGQKLLAHEDKAPRISMSRGTLMLSILKS